MAQRSWINGEASHGGYVIPWHQRWHRGAGLMEKQVMEDMSFHGTRGGTEELD